MLARIESSAITVVSPPNGRAAVAITVHEPPSVKLRRRREQLACDRRVQTVEPVDQYDSVAATSGNPLSGLDDRLDRLPLSVGRDGEGERYGGRHWPLLPLGELLRSYAGEDEPQLQPLETSERAEDATQRLSLARACRPCDHRPRATTQRCEPLDGLQCWVLGVEREPLARVGDLQILIARALRYRIRRLAVDPVDANER